MDVMATLHWIQVAKPWKQCVSHQVAKTCHKIKCEQWQHYPGSINSDDIPFQGMSGKNFVDNETWWTRLKD